MILCATTKKLLAAPLARHIIELCFALQRRKFLLQHGVSSFSFINDIKHRDEIELRDHDRSELKKSRKTMRKERISWRVIFFLY